MIYLFHVVHYLCYGTRLAEKEEEGDESRFQVCFNKAFSHSLEIIILRNNYVEFFKA